MVHFYNLRWNALCLTLNSRLELHLTSKMLLPSCCKDLCKLVWFCRHFTSIKNCTSCHKDLENSICKCTYSIASTSCSQIIISNAPMENSLIFSVLSQYIYWGSGLHKHIAVISCETPVSAPHMALCFWFRRKWTELTRNAPKGSFPCWSFCSFSTTLQCAPPSSCTTCICDIHRLVFPRLMNHFPCVSLTFQFQDSTDCKITASILHEFTFVFTA